MFVYEIQIKNEKAFCFRWKIQTNQIDFHVSEKIRKFEPYFFFDYLFLKNYT